MRTQLLDAAERVWEHIERSWQQLAQVYDGVDKVIATVEILQANTKTLSTALAEALNRWERLIPLIDSREPSFGHDAPRIAELRKLLA
jgi:YD repeat-containing protein